jgi:hypothetical protein
MSEPIVAPGHGNKGSVISDIQARMCKRATFEAAVAELTTVLLRRARQQRMSHGDTPTATATDQHEWDAVGRCAMLLRTRYLPSSWTILSAGLVFVRMHNQCRKLVMPPLRSFVFNDENIA